MTTHLTEDEFADIAALSQTFQTLGKVFQGGEASTAGLRMAAASCRRAADVLDAVADRGGLKDEDVAA